VSSKKISPDAITRAEEKRREEKRGFNVGCGYDLERK